ncbi:MAG: copper resistance protein CopC [Halomonadaceae bacterium T82-2]|nr:MAG: copper resistance protein CopC [Halomonadaceae bacterium T82-2]
MHFKKTLTATFIFGITLVSATLAQAHSALESASPAEGSTVNNVPDELELNFTSPLFLTYVSLTPQDGDSITLKVPGRQLKADYVLPLPELDTGHYTVEWRSMSNDGHGMRDTFSFNLTDK